MAEVTIVRKKSTEQTSDNAGLPEENSGQLHRKT